MPPTWRPKKAHSASPPCAAAEAAPPRFVAPARPADTAVPDGFRRLATETVDFRLDLHGAEPIADLLAMTPHLYRARAEGRARAAALRALTVGVDVRLTRLVRERAAD